jgi:histidinol-phosphate aminotransferase
MPTGLLLAAAHLHGLEPYDARYLPARIYLNANENPFGMPEVVSEALARELPDLALQRYPSPQPPALLEAIARRQGVAEKNVLVGNGGDELLFDVLMAYGGSGRSLLSCPPTFSVYAYDARLTLTGVIEIPRVPLLAAGSARVVYKFPAEELLAAAGREDVAVIILASPNNPTGECVELGFVEQLLQATAAIVLVDQAYVEFADERFDASPLLARYPNLAILRTFSKAYALAGMRIGYLLAAPEVITELKKVRQPYSVNSFSARAAELALAAERYYQQQKSAIIVQRERLQAAFAARGIAAAPSEANFILIHRARAHELWLRLYDKHGILLRDLSDSPGLADCLRVTVGTSEENDELLAALDAL